MNVTARVRKPGDHRFEYEARWHTVALPLYVGLARSFYPKSELATETFNSNLWDEQRVLIVRVLFWTMRVVLKGPLFEPEDDAEPE